MCRSDFCPHTRATGAWDSQKNSQIPNRTMDAWIVNFLSETASAWELRNATDAKITFLLNQWNSSQINNLWQEFKLEVRPPQNKIWGHEWWTFHRPSVTCANALRYSYHLNICSNPKRKQLWISCPRSAWAQTPYVYWKAEIRSAHIHIIINMNIENYIRYYLLFIVYWVFPTPYWLFIHTYMPIYTYCT